jgi:hypothetical protein
VDEENFSAVIPSPNDCTVPAVWAMMTGVNSPAMKAEIKNAQILAVILTWQVLFPFLFLSIYY